MNKNHTLIRDIVPSEIKTPPKVTISKPIKKQISRRFAGRKWHFSGSRLKLIIFLVLFYTASLLVLNQFSRAVVTISLRNEMLSADSYLTISPKSGLSAEVAIFEEEIEGWAESTKTKEFNDRASGQIAIYNAYSSAPQILVDNTRFADPEGRIYRISKSVTVPGAEVVDGQIQPSSIEAEVVADKPGEDYNIGLSDFTIPGFNGSIKYEKFYARSKTPMSGGFVGRELVVSEEEAGVLRQTLKDKLSQKLTARAASELPEDFFMPEDGAVYEFKTKSVEPSAGERGEKFKVILTGQLKAFFVRKNDVSQKILSGYQSDPNFDQIGISNFNELKFNAENLSFDQRSMQLTVEGRARVVWGISEKGLAEELVEAKDSKERLNIFQNYPQIRKATITYGPSWWRIFPKKASKIKVVKTY